MKLTRKTADVHQNTWNRSTMFGANVSFAAAEAYKLLRTNIMYSLTEDECHIIGITSAVSSEGKSTVACNLAYSLAEVGKKVLLIDGDLRLPTVATKLELEKAPGLTELLITRNDFKPVIQSCKDITGLDVLTAGGMAPNPSELLGSDRMAELLSLLSKHYEYILIDLPPVTVVSDALAAAKFLRGIVMVVRRGAAEERELADAMRQLKLVGLRVLGFVFNGSHATTGHYYKKKSYYKSYDSHDKEKKND